MLLSPEQLQQLYQKNLATKLAPVPSLTPNALYSATPSATAATAAAPATGGMSMWPLIAAAAAPGLLNILGGGGRSAPSAGRAGMGRVGPLPAIYQDNPVLFKSMLAQFLRNR